MAAVELNNPMPTGNAPAEWDVDKITPLGGYEDDDTHIFDALDGDEPEGDAIFADAPLGYEDETLDQLCGLNDESGDLFADESADLYDAEGCFADSPTTPVEITVPDVLHEDDICDTSDITADTSGPLDPLQSDSADTDDGPPATPEIDYDDIDITSTSSADDSTEPRDRKAESKAAAEALAEMGLAISTLNKKKKKKKNRSKSKKPVVTRSESLEAGSNLEDNKDLVVSKSKRTQKRTNSDNASDTPPDTVDSTKLGPLPSDSSAHLINEHDAALGQNSIEADTQSPNDVLLTFRSRLHMIEDAVGQSPGLRYTSIASSAGYLALGCASGGTFIFSRSSHQFQCVLAGSHADGGVVQLHFAPDDHLLAIATASGSIDLWRGPWGHLTEQPQRLKTVVEHSGADIKSMSWSSNSASLIVGDSTGLVTRTPVVKKPVVPSASKVFPRLRVLQKVVSNVVPQTDVIHRCGCSVVQVTAGKAGAVLISSERQAIIADPSRRILWPVGTKTRSGNFGACFGLGGRWPAIFSARPGSRIWIAKSRTGSVTATISVKTHFDCPSTPILRTDNAGVPEPIPSKGPIGTNFAQLLLVRGKYLLSWSRDQINVIDPGKARLVGWYAELSGIIDVHVNNEEIYVLCEVPSSDKSSPSQSQVYHLALLSPGETAAAMTVSGNVRDAAAMVAEYAENATPENFLQNVQESDLQLVQQSLEAEDSDVDATLIEQIKTLASRAAALRIEEENRLALNAEQAFLDRVHDRDANSIVVDAGDTCSDDNDFTSSLPGMSPAPSVASMASGAASVDPAEVVLAGEGGEFTEYGELDGPILT